MTQLLLSRISKLSLKIRHTLTHTHTPTSITHGLTTAERAWQAKIAGIQMGKKGITFI